MHYFSLDGFSFGSLLEYILQHTLAKFQPATTCNSQNTSQNTQKHQKHPIALSKPVALYFGEEGREGGGGGGRKEGGGGGGGRKEAGRGGWESRKKGGGREMGEQKGWGGNRRGKGMEEQKGLRDGRAEMYSCTTGYTV